MSVYKSVDSTKYAGHWKRRKLQKFYPLKSLSEWKQWLMGRNLQREKKKKGWNLSAGPTGEPGHRRNWSRFFQNWHSSNAASFAKFKLLSFYSEMTREKAAMFTCCFSCKSYKLIFQVKMCKSDRVVGHK